MWSSWTFRPFSKLILSVFSFQYKFNYSNLIGVLLLVRTMIRRPRMSRSRLSEAKCTIKGFPSHQPLPFLRLTDLEHEHGPGPSCPIVSPDVWPRMVPAKPVITALTPKPERCVQVHPVDGSSRSEPSSPIPVIPPGFLRFSWLCASVPLDCQHSRAMVFCSLAYFKYCKRW